MIVATMSGDIDWQPCTIMGVDKAPLIYAGSIMLGFYFSCDSSKIICVCFHVIDWFFRIYFCSDFTTYLLNCPLTEEFEWETQPPLFFFDHTYQAIWDLTTCRMQVDTTKPLNMLLYLDKRCWWLLYTLAILI